MPDISSPTMLSLLLKTLTGPPSRTKDAKGRTVTLCYQALTKSSAETTLILLVPAWSYQAWICLHSAWTAPFCYLFSKPKYDLMRNVYKNHKVCIYPPPPLQAGCNMRSIFKQNTTGLNSEISFSYIGCLSSTKESTLPYYLPIVGERTDKFIPFPRTLAQSETQRV